MRIEKPSVFFEKIGPVGLVGFNQVDVGGDFEASRRRFLASSGLQSKPRGMVAQENHPANRRAGFERRSLSVVLLRFRQVGIGSAVSDTEKSHSRNSLPPGLPASSKPLVGNVLSSAIEGLKIYWVAILLMQICAVATAVAFFIFPSVRDFAGALARLKDSGGLLFAAVATVLGGGVLPELLKWKLRPKSVPAPSAAELTHQFAYFAIAGVLVSLFYSLQTVLFGAGNEWWRVGTKILADQFVYTPFFALPFLVAWFALREEGYRPGRFFAALTPSLFLERIPPVYLPNLIYWTPALVAVYSLPAPVQFLLFQFLNAGWSIIMVFIARRQVAHSRPQ